MPLYIEINPDRSIKPTFAEVLVREMSEDDLAASSAYSKGLILPLFIDLEPAIEPLTQVLVRQYVVEEVQIRKTATVASLNVEQAEKAQSENKLKTDVVAMKTKAGQFDDRISRLEESLVYLISLRGPEEPIENIQTDSEIKITDKKT